MLRLIVLVLASLANSPGGIPEPDVTLYGSLMVDGVVVRATDNISIFARVVGLNVAVGTYSMGANQGASGQCAGGTDCYVLKIKLESTADGQLPRSGDAALVGETVHLFVSKNGGPEAVAGTFVITQRGQIVEMNLSAQTVPDLDADGSADLKDVRVFQTCFTGVGGTPVSGVCIPADRDGDGDVDLHDYKTVGVRLGGPL